MNGFVNGSYNHNADKCESMQITHSRDKSLTTCNYTLRKPCKEVNSFTDLGVTITKDLSWGIRISMTIKQTKYLLQSNALLALLTQRFFPCCTNLLYGQSWNTRFQSGALILPKDIHALFNECVQRRASRLALNQRKDEMSYEDRCQLLIGLPYVNRELIYP